MKSLVFALALCGCAAVAHAAPARHATLPAVSPDGKRVVFLADRDGDTSQVWVIGTDGNGSKRLTVTPGRKETPRWSRDGKLVQYRTRQRDSLFLWSMPATGGKPSLTAAIQARTAAWSNDGRLVAYTWPAYARNKIMVGRADGRAAVAVTDSIAGYFNIAWSPDDQQLAATFRDTTNDLQVWVMDADGRRGRPLTHFASTERPQMPAWSPDGKKIALQAGPVDRSDSTTTRVHLWIVDVATAEATQVTKGEGHADESPAWFPDGKRLAFQSDRSGAMEIWVVNVDGSGERQITR